MARNAVKGTQKLNAAFAGMVTRVNSPSLDKVLKESLTPMKDEAVANAKRLRQPGTKAGTHLDQGIVVAKRKSPGARKRLFWIALRKRARRIGHLVEFGTAPHAQPNRGIMHPGARPKPWFRPAYAAHKYGVISNASRGIWGVMTMGMKQGFIGK